MSISDALRSRLIQVQLSPPLGGAEPTTHSIGVSMERQFGDNWCWAAVSVSLRNFQNFASPLPQCELAKIQFGHNDCCTLPLAKRCDQPSSLEVALANAGVTADNQSGALSFSDLQQRILDDKPVCCAIRWPSNTYHFVQIDGFSESGPRGNEVVVNDPLLPGGRITYDALLSNYNGSSGTWVWSYRVL